MRLPMSCISLLIEKDFPSLVRFRFRRYYYAHKINIFSTSALGFFHFNFWAKQRNRVPIGFRTTYFLFFHVPVTKNSPGRSVPILLSLLFRKIRLQLLLFIKRFNYFHNFQAQIRIKYLFIYIFTCTSTTWVIEFNPSPSLSTVFDSECVRQYSYCNSFPLTDNCDVAGSRLFVSSVR